MSIMNKNTKHIADNPLQALHQFRHWTAPIISIIHFKHV